jgi:hypothetical protein
VSAWCVDVNQASPLLDGGRWDHRLVHRVAPLRRLRQCFDEKEGKHAQCVRGRPGKEGKQTSRVPLTGERNCSAIWREALIGWVKKGTETFVSFSVHVRVSQITSTR